MSQENVEIVRRFYAALHRRDKEGCVREMHPEVEGVVYFMESEGRTYRGHQGVRESFDDLSSASSLIGMSSSRRAITATPWLLRPV